jgi:hypothetical protein
MSDKKAQKNGSLIPSEKSQLIKYSNVLISRGLDLAKAIEKRGSIHVTPLPIISVGVHGTWKATLISQSRIITRPWT